MRCYAVRVGWLSQDQAKRAGHGGAAVSASLMVYD